MKILSVSPFQEGLQRNITMLDRLSTEMETIDRAVRDLVEMEEQLKGMGGSAIRSFYRECHLPFLLFFRMFSNRFKQVLLQMEAALHSLEPDPSGYIDEQFLEGELEQGLTLIGRLTASLTDEANSIMDKVSDIVGLPHLDDSEVQEGVIHSKRKRDDTIAQLYEFDATQTFALNAIEHDLLAMDNWLATIEGLFQSGVQDINFQTSQWNVLTFGSEIRTELLPKVFLDPWGNEHEKLLGTMLTAATFKTLEGKKVNTIDQNVDENVKYQVYNNGLLIKEYMVGSSVFYEVVPHVEYKEEEIITATVAEENNWVDDLQFGLDLVGLIPVIGEPADGLNAIIYAARGDTVNAALSVGGMIPVAGWFSTGGKLVYKSTTNVKQVKNVVSTDAMKSIYTPIYQDVINSPLSKSQNHLDLLSNNYYQLGKLDNVAFNMGKSPHQFNPLTANGYQFSTPNNITFNKPLVKTDISAPSKSRVSDVKVDMKKNVDVETKGTVKDKGVSETNLTNIDDFINGNKKFDEVIEDFAKVYKEHVDLNKPWSWDDTIPGGDSLSSAQKRKIKEMAIEKGHIPEIKVTKADGMRYGFADFASAGVVEETVQLPERFWKLSDKEQFKWLDEQIGGTRKGMTWHHTEVPGKMELVPFGIHNITPHNGGRTKGMWADAPR
ncbi:hypothetical protein NCCP2222_26090 [Sporosarcina sp. NCCP-2222]|uniref:T7SS effector LXG polymorphic toxin n=1 Tax=Sporosarcina sp. NCCP-2222 TaxID=2935073 RepID=UPI00208834F0|nr:T7SS effector LXG polymorphic toxin [Sporosarcina sp. NCCP-2222]GKV56662.1 hypothetical protein NCCP2222_26090 [Sporosarcina sp. NCCP-2222]